MVKIIKAVVWIGLLCSTQLFAQVYKYSNEFLNLGVGARAYGMGGAVIASVDDVTAGYWNPAGLLEIKDNIQLCFMHNEQFAGIAKHDYGAVAFKLNDKSAMAVNVIRYGIDDIPNTLNLFQNGQIDYSRITNFSAIDYAFIGSYARKLNISGLNVGGNVKIIRRVVGDFANAWGFGFDVGAQYKRGPLRAAATLRDATSTFNAWKYTFSEQDKQILVSTGNALPSNNLELTLPRLSTGAAYKFKWFGNKLSLQPEVNADFTFDGKRNTLVGSDFASIDTRIGVESGYKDFVFFRLGANQFQRIKQLDGEDKLSVVPSIGIGLKLKNITVDYALADVGEASGVLPFSNIISVKLNINRKVE